MLMLACDTSNSSCCAGLYEDGKEISYELSLEKKTHSETFMPLVERVLQKAGKKPSDIDVIAVTAGPGSFTGIRIGLSAVKGMSLGLGIGCIPVSSTKALALSVDNVSKDRSSTLLVPCFDARNNRVFASVISDLNGDTVIEEGAYDASELALKITSLEGISQKKIITVGNGSEAMKGALEGKGLDVQYAGGCVILPSGVAKASQGIPPVSGAELSASYCAVSSAERLRR